MTIVVEPTSAQQEYTRIEVDDDIDSTLGDDDYASSTGSLESSTNNYVWENGRRYHGFKQGKYVFPNDEGEAEREDMKHHVSRLILSDRLYTASFVEAPKQVLDIGTGTGIWAIDFADENPSSFVIAIDLSPIQPNLVPPNLEFQIDDIEDDWTFRPSSFDFIHCRHMSTAIKDWDKLIQQSHDALAPGGILELTDMDIYYTSDDGTVTETNKFASFMADIRRAGPKLGIDLTACTRHPGMLEKAGFINVRTEVYKLPFGPWPRDRRLKEIGYLHREQFLRGMEGIAMGMYGRGMGWSKPEIDVLLAGVRKDIMDRKIHGYWLIYFTTAEVSKSTSSK